MRKFCLALTIASLPFLLTSSLSADSVQWVLDVDGNWEDAANWSSNPSLPASGDDAVIDVGGATVRTITIGSGTQSVNTLTSQENVTLAGGHLTLANGGVVNGALSLGVTRNLTINGGSFAAAGSTNLDGGNVFAAGGSIVDLSAATSYVTDTGTNSNRTLRASAASSLDLSGMATLTGGGFIRRLFVEAIGGSTVDLSGLIDAPAGATTFLSEGGGSQLNLSSLTSVHNNNGNRSGRLRAISGGSLDASQLQSLTATVDSNNGIEVDGASSTLVLGSLTTFQNSIAEFRNGGTADMSTVTDFTGSSITHLSGNSINLPGVTSYNANGGGNGNRTWSVENAGSLLNASAITTADAGSFVRTWDVTASAGGKVDLSGMAMIASGAANFTASGTGSLIDLSALTSFDDNNGNRGSLLTATDGGEVRLDTASATNITLNNVDITVEPSGILNASRVTTYTGGTFTTNGVDQALNITSGDGSSYVAHGGAVLSVAGLVTVNNVAAETITLRADGVSSNLLLPNLVGLTNSTGVNATMRIEAVAGGVVSLTALQSISAPTGIINSAQPIEILADGTNSFVNLEAITTISSLSSVSRSSLTVRDGGRVHLGFSGPTQLTNVVTTVESTGQLIASELELISQNINSSGDSLDQSILQGTGTVTANVRNTSGVIQPGIDSLATLTIDGHLTQDAEGIVEVDLISGIAGIDADLVDVTGAASIDGTLLISLAGTFPEYTAVPILQASAGVTGTFAQVVDPVFSTNRGIAVTYNSNQVLAQLVLMGDANLDMVVDVSDFNIWNVNKFTDGVTWEQGDFNGDGQVDVSDFNLWNNNKFTQFAPRPVPEPSGWLIGLGACLAGMLRRRGRPTAQ